MKKQIGVDNGTKTLEEIARSILSKMAFGILSYYRSIPSSCLDEVVVVVTPCVGEIMQTLPARCQL